MGDRFYVFFHVAGPEGSQQTIISNTRNQEELSARVSSTHASGVQFVGDIIVEIHNPFWRKIVGAIKERGYYSA